MNDEIVKDGNGFEVNKGKKIDHKKSIKLCCRVYKL